MINFHLLYNRLAIWKDIQKRSVTSNTQSRDFMSIILGKKPKKQKNNETNKKNLKQNKNLKNIWKKKMNPLHPPSFLVTSYRGELKMSIKI